MKLVPRPVLSSLGSKYVMAITGLMLIGFVIAHMVGNLLIYAGQDSLNTYAHALKSKPVLLWTARLGLLVVFLLHVVLGLRLTWLNKKARPVRYVYEDTLQASWASRHMLLTGLVLLAFVIYHIAHFTLGVVASANVQYVDGRVEDLPQSKNYGDLSEKRLHPTTEHPRQDVYSMVISGFRNPWISLSYLAAMAFLGLHLWHGGSSWFQSLGWNSSRHRSLIGAIGPILAVVVVAGNCSIVLSVWLGVIPPGR
jgi:succinate dehydrogenase / fumarate reductase cytochrome b subunit